MQELQNNTKLQGGKYRILSTLGQGGFGITYLAEQVMLGRKVAIKEFFMKDYCNRDEATSHVSVGTEGSIATVDRYKEKFLKEAKLIAGMNHHNIVQIFDIFEENGTAYYVMEHLDGGSLDDKVSQAPLSEIDALKYIREMADALGYIHSNNILHLDVKPTNVLLRGNGESVLIDFGISKRYDEQGSQTSTTPVGISKGYAPMEQYNQGLATFSPATDIYSLGATLYKLITGNTPPEASLLFNEVEELEKPANVSFATWTAIEKAMEPRVKRRPQNVADFLSLIGNNVEGPSVGPVVVEAEDGTKVPPPEYHPKAINATPPTYQPQKPQEKTSEDVFNVNGVKFKMIKVEGGTFGRKTIQKSGFLGLSKDEIIQNVTLHDYWIAETQVTQALWKAVMGENPSKFKGDNLPVERVNWYVCKTFIEKLSVITGKRFRFPTEAEWEFAAIGGKKSNYNLYSGSAYADDVAWHAGNSVERTHDVAIKQPNELGIFDMSGNVWEWCGDWYSEFYEDSWQLTNPYGPEKGSCRVFRGGSWCSSALLCRVSYRNYGSLDLSDSSLGLRLALSE